MVGVGWLAVWLGGWVESEWINPKEVKGSEQAVNYNILDGMLILSRVE